jgi:hypothetical protein
MKSDQSKAFYHRFLDAMRAGYAADKIKDGEFGAMMQVDIQNDGPVTIVIDSPDKLASSYLLCRIDSVDVLELSKESTYVDINGTHSLLNQIKCACAYGTIRKQSGMKTRAIDASKQYPKPLDSSTRESRPLANQTQTDRQIYTLK